MNDASLGSTELIVFRPVHRTPAPYACDTTPAAFSAGVASLMAYDRNDMSTAITGFTPGFVAGRVAIGAGGIQAPYGQGALEVNLNFQETENALPGNDTAHMGFIGAVHRLAGISDPVFAQGFPLHLAGEL